MVIECKGCSKRFRLDETLLKPGGSRARSPKCGDVFKAYPSETNTFPEVATVDITQFATQAVRAPITRPAPPIRQQVRPLL